MTMIDAHQHFWRMAKGRHQWSPELGSILNRDFVPNDYRHECQLAGVEGGILVQSVNDSSETEEFLVLAAEDDSILGVVGWVPLSDPQAASEKIEQYLKLPKFVGIRHLINFETDEAWLLRPNVLEAIYIVDHYNLVLDTVPVNERQMRSVMTVADRCPTLEIVIDHLGCPPVNTRSWESWASLIEEAAAFQNISIKLSIGLNVISSWRWNTEELRPYTDHVLTKFGADRIMAASNWPVILLGGNYPEIWKGTTALLHDLDPTQRADVLSKTARRVFKLPSNAS